MNFYAATALSPANFALVRFGVVDTKPFRWLHHALFFAVFASAALAVGVGYLQGAPYRWVLLPVLTLLVAVPRVRAGEGGHDGARGARLLRHDLLRHRLRILALGGL